MSQPKREPNEREREMAREVRREFVHGCIGITEETYHLAEVLAAYGDARAAEEREACAKVASSCQPSVHGVCCGTRAAAAIRRRGQP